jgi:hypothetical protein
MEFPGHVSPVPAGPEGSAPQRGYVKVGIDHQLTGAKNKDCFLYRPRFHDPRDRIKCLTRGGVSGGLVPPLADSERFSPIPQASDSHRVRYSGASAKMRLLSSLASTSPVTQLIGPGNF